MSHLVPAFPPIHRASSFVAPAYQRTARDDLPSVAQLTRRHTAPVVSSPERPPKTPIPNRGHFQPYPSYSQHSSPPSSPHTPARPSTSRAAYSSGSLPTRQLSFPTQPTESDPDALILHPPYAPKLNYVGIVDAKNPSKFLDEKDFVDAKGNTIQEYPYRFEPVRGVGGLKSGPIEDTECLRCTFCRKKYRGKNSKSMWRRHVQKSHKIKLQNYRERNKENDIDEEMMSPVTAKSHVYPKLSATPKPTPMVAVLPTTRMPLIAVMNGTVPPAVLAAAAAAAVPAQDSAKKVKIAVKPTQDVSAPKTVPKATKSAPKAEKRAEPPKWPTTTTQSSQGQSEPEFTLDSSDGDDDDETETFKIQCPHLDDEGLPCHPCTAQFKGIKKGLRRTASMMTLLSPVESLPLKDTAHSELPFFAPPPPPVLPEFAISPHPSPVLPAADEMIQDPDSSQDDLLGMGSQLSFLSDTDDEWVYEREHVSESEPVFEPSMPSSPPNTHMVVGLGFDAAFFEPAAVTFDMRDLNMHDDVSSSPMAFDECDDWLAWDEPAILVAA